MPHTILITFVLHFVARVTHIRLNEALQKLDFSAHQVAGLTYEADWRMVWLEGWIIAWISLKLK